MKFIHDKNVIFLIGMAVLIAISICVVFLYPRPQECFYSLTVESIYHFPWWNITLWAHEDMPKISEIQLRYGEQWLEKHMIDTSLEVGDKLTCQFKLNVHIVPGENFILYLYFEHNYYMTINLMLPEEHGGDSV